MTKDALTLSVLIYLFRHQGEGGKQFHHYLYDDLGHRPRRRDCGINIEAADEVFDGFEQLDKRVIIGADVLDRLMCLHFTRMYISETKEGSYREKDGEGREYRLCRWECLHNISSET